MEIFTQGGRQAKVVDEPLEQPLCNGREGDAMDTRGALRILLIEDSAVFVLSVQHMLEQVEPKWRLEAVNTLVDGLMLLARDRVDLVLLDLTLPDSEAESTFRRLSRQVPNVPVVILSSSQDTALAVSTLRQGAMDYLVKDQVTPSVLAQAVRRALERKQAEAEALRQAGLLGNIRDAIISTDLEQQILSWSKGAEVLYQWTAQEALGRHTAALLHTEYLTTSQPQATEEILSEGHWQGELRQTRRDGATIIVHSSVSLLCDRQGEAEGLVVVNRDITERKRVEDALEEALRDSHKHQEETLALLKGTRAILSLNSFHEVSRTIVDQCRELVGARAGVLTLRNEQESRTEALVLATGVFQVAFDPELFVPLHGMREEAYRNGRVVWENRATRNPLRDFSPDCDADDESILFAPLLIDGQVAGLLGLVDKENGFSQEDSRIASAFTELISVALVNSRIRESLISSEERFRSLASSASDAIISIDGENRIAFWNQAAELLFGYTEQEALGRSFLWLFPEHSKAHIEEQLGNVRDEEFARLTNLSRESTGLRKDGREFPLELSLAAWRSGGEIFLTGIARDLSERKQAQQMQADMIRTVVHDLSNPIAAIQAALELAPVESGELGPRMVEYVHIMKRNTERLSGLTRNLMEAARIDTGDLALRKEPIVLGPFLAEFALLERPVCQEKKIRCTVELPDQPVWVEADRGRLEEIVSNLLENAIKFTPLDGTILLSLETEGEWAILSVTDNGPGIAPEHLPHLFERFYRGSGKHHGSGLGLFIVRWLVEAHGGTIQAQSEIGRGASFQVRLPLIPAPAS
ncbi:MAG: PAS domain S-box protein [Coprothermobacterota bacterium]|nr:PAS domain S-box protein [Coprothermobacterota bacterium]